MVLDIPYGHSAGVQANDHRIEPIQTTLALTHQARGEGPGPVPGHLDLKRTHLRVHHLRRGSVPGIAARLAGWLALVVAQVLGQLSSQAPLQGLLDQGRQQAISPGHVHLPGINLLKQAVQSPGLAQLVDHIPPTSRSPVVVIGSNHQCQSFHKGLHKPLNRLQQPPDGLILTQPWSRGPAGAAVTETIYYQYRASRARRTLRGISEQVSKAERVVAGKIPVKRNRFITLTGAQKSVNRDLEAKAKALAGWKGYITNLADPRPEYVIGAYHQLWQIEKSFRMSKSDLKARPIYHHLKDSIEAHLTIVFAALAVARWLEATTKVSLKTLVKTLRRYRTIDIQAGDTIVTAEDPIPNNTQTWLNAIHNTQERH